MTSMYRIAFSMAVLSAAAVGGGCMTNDVGSDRDPAKVDHTGEEIQPVTCNPSLVYYPVRGPHNNGYDSTAGNSSLWTCNADNSNSDFVAGDHLGNDIWAARGTPVVATVSGTATLVGFTDYSGNKVTIIDSCGWYHFSTHLDSIAPGITNGTHVTAGTVIGYVGNSGTASNGVIHLHYSIYPDNNYDAGIDPWPYLRAVESNVCGRQLTTPGDVDGDGRADLVTAHVNGNAYVYAGAASGAFGSVAVNFAGTLDSALLDGTGHHLVGVADVTGDGLSDLVSVASSGTAVVWPGRPDRTFGGAVTSFNGTMALATATSAGHDPVAVADVDGDGMADLITVHSSGNVYVYRGTASGNFVGGVASFAGTFQSALRTGVGHWVVGAADVTGDGRADLVTVHSNGNAYVYPGRADGSFAGAISSFAGTMHAAVLDGQAGHVPVGVADVTGDGRADLVTVHSNGNAYVYPGSADGSFAGGVSSFAGTLAMGQFGATGHQVIGALDVTGDGRADLVTLSGGTVYVYPGTATGAFGGSTASFAGTMDSAFTDTTGHELVQMGPVARRRACPTTGCRML
jgi:hypothetical protein